MCLQNISFRSVATIFFFVCMKLILHALFKSTTLELTYFRKNNKGQKQFFSVISQKNVYITVSKKLSAQFFKTFLISFCVNLKLGYPHEDKKKSLMPILLGIIRNMEFICFYIIYSFIR